MPKKTISKDIPLSEITLRKYEKPSDLTGRDLLRKLCLSIGLLQPGDSRDIIVEVFQALLHASKSKKFLNSYQVMEEVVKLRKKNNLALRGIAESNIRRQLKRLRDIFLVEKIANDYRITEFEDIHIIFDQKIKKFYLDSIVSRVEEYFNALK